METSLPVPSSLPAVEAEIGEITALMSQNSAAYWRDEGKQSRLRDLYRARIAATAPAQSSILNRGDGEPDPAQWLTPLSSDQFHALQADCSYTEYLARWRHVGDVLTAIPASEHESFTRAFEALPDAVTVAMVGELMNTMGTGFRFVSDEELADRVKHGRGVDIVVREWGADAKVKMATVQDRLERLMISIDEDDDIEAFLDWLSGLNAKQAAAVYRKLAA